MQSEASSAAASLLVQQGFVKRRTVRSVLVHLDVCGDSRVDSLVAEIVVVLVLLHVLGRGGSYDGIAVLLGIDSLRFGNKGVLMSMSLGILLDRGGADRCFIAPDVLGNRKLHEPLLSRLDAPEALPHRLWHLIAFATIQKLESASRAHVRCHHTGKCIPVQWRTVLGRRGA